MQETLDSLSGCFMQPSRAMEMLEWIEPFTILRKRTHNAITKFQVILSLTGIDSANGRRVSLCELCLEDAMWLGKNSVDDANTTFQRRTSRGQGWNNVQY
jgi:hypothetical protein